MESSLSICLSTSLSIGSSELLQLADFSFTVIPTKNKYLNISNTLYDSSTLFIAVDQEVTKVYLSLSK